MAVNGLPTSSKTIQRESKSGRYSDPHVIEEENV